MEKKIAAAAARIARSWPVEINGQPVEGLERAILHRLGFGRESGCMPVVSSRLMSMIRTAGFTAVRKEWEVQQ